MIACCRERTPPHLLVDAAHGWRVLMLLYRLDAMLCSYLSSCVDSRETWPETKTFLADAASRLCIWLMMSSSSSFG